jgi:hypothetical protein
MNEPRRIFPSNISASAPADPISDEIEERDLALFKRITSTSLKSEQEHRFLRAPRVYPEEEAVLAIHWHPEFIPMELAARRIDIVFPNRASDLIIPTQHNMLTSFGDFTGVEVDCYSAGFNRKVQLLLHFENGRLTRAHSLELILEHTFRYRSTQLFHYLRAVTRPDAEILDLAARSTGADETLVRFVRGYTRKVERLIEETADQVPPQMIKNRIVRDFFDGLRDRFPGGVIDRAQIFLASVKQSVKERFPLSYFYRTSEVIEEARALGGCIVVPHPEQFWPVLLADYDVDGYEVWNPQSHTYTEFLISVVKNKNRRLRPSERPLLVFMGDDTHLSEKVRPPEEQDQEKAGREVGLQPAWEDGTIARALAVAGMNKRQIIQEYRQRLTGA